MPKALITYETKAGSPVAVGKTQLIPFSKVYTLHFPGTSGGLVWNRPSAVLAITPDGEDILLPVRDVTRERQIALLGIGLVAGLLIWLLRRP